MKQAEIPSAAKSRSPLFRVINHLTNQELWRILLGMKDNAQQPKTLQDAMQYFSDEQVCIDTVAALRWPDGPVCPACGHKEHYYLKTQHGGNAKNAISSSP